MVCRNFVLPKSCELRQFFFVSTFSRLFRYRGMKKLQFILFLLVPIVNFGSTILFDSQFDDDARVLIQPAGYAFSIWGPIFLGMIIYSWFQMQPGRTDSPHLRTATIAGIFAALASISFVPISFTNIQWLGFANILWHLIALTILFIALRKQIKLENNQNTHWYYLPTQMYLGWICAATAVSAALMLTEAGLILPLEQQVTITAVIIGALVLIGIFMAFQKGMVVPLVFIWASIGIIAENGMYPTIKYASIAAIVILAIVSLSQIAKRKRLAF